MRFRLAIDPPLLSAMLKIFLQTLFAWQRKRGRKIGLVQGETGSVSGLQRMGSFLNVNIHIHAILPDGLFVPSSDGSLRFAPLPPPTTEDVKELLSVIASRCTDRLTRTYEEGGDGLALEPELAALYEALHGAVTAPSDRSGTATLNGFEEAGSDSVLPSKPLCANLAGFSLHAAQSVPAHDREALERLLRYILRPPFAQKRLSLSPEGRVVYKLRRPWINGATELILDPLDFLRRLTALLPRPYAHAVRYHGLC